MIQLFIPGLYCLQLEKTDIHDSIVYTRFVLFTMTDIRSKNNLPSDLQKLSCHYTLHCCLNNALDISKVF